MSIFNFDGNNNDKNRKKIVTPLQRLGKALYYQQDRQNRKSCQLCGDVKPEILSQLWIDEIPLAHSCSDCVARIQQLVKNTRKYNMDLKKIIEEGKK